MMWKRRKKQRPPSSSVNRLRPGLERLEDRLAPATLIEGFDNPAAFGNWTAVLRNLPSQDTQYASEAAHDGATGLLKTDGSEWLVRNDAAAQVGQGQVLSA